MNKTVYVPGAVLGAVLATSFSLMIAAPLDGARAASHGDHKHEKEHEHEHEHQKAHEHGVGQLNLVLEGNELEMELTAPGADIVGFEYEPKTAEEKKAVDDAIHDLEDIANLVAVPGSANCRVEEAEVEGGHHEDEHKHDGHEHDDHAKHDGDQEEHSEFKVHYHLDCESPDALTHLDLTYFSAFPRAAKVKVRFITPKGQGAQTLTASDNRLMLR